MIAAATSVVSARMPLAIGTGRVGEWLRVNVRGAIAPDAPDGCNALRERVIAAIVAVAIPGEPRAPRRRLERGPGTDHKHGRDRRSSGQRPNGVVPAYPGASVRSMALVAEFAGLLERDSNQRPSG